MTNNTNRVLITGGAGRLGTILSRAILDQGFNVRIFDLFNKKNQKNVKTLSDKLEVYWGDITDPDSVKKALHDIDMVLHMAAILPPWAYINPERTFHVNAGGTKNLVDAIKETGRYVPLIYTSSAAAFGPTPEATEPLCCDKTECKPKGAYGESKHMAERYIKESGLDFVILRLTATMYLSFDFSDFKRMFSIPLNNRIEYCHPFDTANAIVKTIKTFDQLKGNTLMISGGPDQRMIYKDMVSRMLQVYGLPLPPASKFTKNPYYLDWYDTTKSQGLLNFQKRSFNDFLHDLSQQINKAYSPLFIPMMRNFIGPVFGKLIVRMI